MYFYVKLIRLYGNLNLCKYYVNENLMYYVMFFIEYRKIGMVLFIGVNKNLNI